jgi:hypothetical protein
MCSIGTNAAVGVNPVNNFGINSSNGAIFLTTEIAAAAGSRHPDDEVIYQVELENSAAFENSSGEAHIRLRRGRVTGGMIVHHDEGVGGENNRRLKHFARMRERLIHTALANRGDLD